MIAETKPKSEKFNDDWSTPQWLFRGANSRVLQLTGRKINLDAAAASWNRKCERFHSETESALRPYASWRGNVWLNPPFSQLEAFVARALKAAKRGSTVAMLLPYRNQCDWWQDARRAGCVHDVIGSARFRSLDGSTINLNRGFSTSAISIVIVGPDVAPATTGEPIRRTMFDF